VADWSFDPGVLLTLVVMEVLYVRALRVLAGRGVRAGRFQIVLWHLGILLWVAGLVSPVDVLAEEGLTFHMTQHLLIADLAAPLLIAGIRNPVLAFFLPRPALVALARRRRLRSLFRTLRRPPVAVGIYVFVLYAWHFDGLFELAVRNDFVHAIQHGSFVGIGVLVWWSALEPQRRRFAGELWKIGHILGTRLLGMFVGMAFVLIRQPVYTGVYGTGERALGLGAVSDQQLAGAIMVTVDIYLMVFALCLFFYRAAQDSARLEERERAAREAAVR
jgi:cytochrome c oxidase assembly factor CtaG